MTPIRTTPYHLPRKNFAREIISGKSLKWLYAGISSVAVCILVSVLTSDLRWGIISLMILLLITPMMLSLAYYSQAFNPLTSYNLLEHTISADETELTVEIAVTDNDCDNDESETVVTRQIHYKWDNLTEYTPSSTGIKLRFNGQNGGFIILPFSTFKSTDELASFVDLFTSFLHKRP